MTKPPTTRKVDHDPQQERLYEWERAFVEPKCPPQIMSIQEVRGLVARACGLAQIREPSIKFTSINVACKAYPGRNELEIADWGRSRPTILHEIAHLASWDWVLAGDAPHGRVFTTFAIVLYNRFLGLSIEYLTDTAASRNLAFDPLGVHGLLPSEGMKDFFPDDI